MISVLHAIAHVLDAPRPLSDIAADIRKHWPAPYFAAVPYLCCMAGLNSIEDSYGPSQESARSIVSYFLANAGTWRGEDARRIKAELNAMLREG